MMNVVFYISAAVAIVSTALAISRSNAVHALLNLIVSLLAVAVIFFTLGAPFIAALEVIIYAGAIMVVFVFVVMLLNLGDQAAAQERQWFSPGIWIAPGILTTVLMVELAYMLITSAGRMFGTTGVAPRQIAIALFGPYLLGVELASLLLLSGLVGACHLGHRNRREERNEGGA
jgi:NADH-quinone oxidoreductase subunit J